MAKILKEYRPPSQVESATVELTRKELELIYVLAGNCASNGHSHTEAVDGLYEMSQSLLDSPSFNDVARKILENINISIKLQKP